MSSFEAAQQMLTRVRLVLGDVSATWGTATGTWAEGVPNWAGAVVTIDPVEAAAALGGGLPTVVVQPPTAAFPTWTMTDFEWSVVVIAPTQNVLEAWPTLSNLIDQLREPLELNRATLTMWQPPQGAAWPCAHLTLTTSTID